MEIGFKDFLLMIFVQELEYIIVKMEQNSKEISQKGSFLMVKENKSLLMVLNSMKDNLKIISIKVKE
jgi:hypothetical protein